MPLSWNEIESRAVAFASRWAGETYEKGESQSFWSEFLDVFGVDRRRHGAFFEYAIKKSGGQQGFIDLFWPGKLLAEQKSGGRDLGDAKVQAYDYLPNMPDADLPLGIVVSDFATFRFIDLESKAETEFVLADLPKQVRLFGFLVGQQSRQLAEEEPVNRQAAEAMARLHNALREDNYTGHDLELLLVRLVFCFFADDAGIFARKSLEEYLERRTAPDGSDFGSRMREFFEVLRTPEDQRQSSLDQDLASFPYINGGLFAESLRTPSFRSDMRQQVLMAMRLDWSKVSPAIFGSMFQGVMDEAERRNLGAHYTSEANILKVIKPLFLDGLYEEFARVKRSKAKLAEFHDKLAGLTFLDPACGSGNFLVITYRELRRLEHKVIDLLYKDKGNIFDASGLEGVGSRVRVNVDQMNGIEIEEFPALIAQTALWLTDHQMNMEFSQLSGSTFKRLPLTKSANIVNANALQQDWTEVIEPQKLDFIIGNPPFIGAKIMSQTQRDEVKAVFNGQDKVGVLDFVSAWYAKAARMMDSNPAVRAALVSTNSITQGEQVGILWKYLFDLHIAINFAHRTFKWTNDAKGVAAVYCVIIGFSKDSHQAKDKYIFDYPDIRGEAVEQSVEHINPYLVNAPDVLIQSRSKPICDVPVMVSGNKPIDGGNYLFTPQEKAEFLQLELNAEKFFKRWLGGVEFLNGIERWYLYLDEASPSELKTMPHVLKRIEAVRQYRLSSPSSSTRKIADYPTRFHTRFISKSNYIALPEVSSERRNYIPIQFLGPDVLCSNKLRLVDHANLYEFAVLTSGMHMSWTRAVTGRLKSDYQYSKDIVYNNFVWPENVTEDQKSEIETLAQAILATRGNYPNSTLADLYDPLTMPPDLLKAHKSLDKAIDKLYRKKPFADDAERVALLFNKYKERDGSS